MQFVSESGYCFGSGKGEQREGEGKTRGLWGRDEQRTGPAGVRADVTGNSL